MYRKFNYSKGNQVNSYRNIENIKSIEIINPNQNILQ